MDLTIDQCHGKPSKMWGKPHIKTFNCITKWLRKNNVAYHLEFQGPKTAKTCENFVICIPGANHFVCLENIFSSYSRYVMFEGVKSSCGHYDLIKPTHKRHEQPELF
jgi:hypothetical protein